MASLGARRLLRDSVEDESVIRLMRQTTEALEPDALYRRRLRGEVLNLHVALREGLVAPRRPRTMTAIGRAVLLTSLTLAVSVSAAGAAAQSAIPGELLYPVKRQLEEIRLQLATGAARGDLLEMAAAQRLEELERLATAGEWILVSSATGDLAAAEDALVSTGRQLDADHQALLDQRIARLEGLLAAAPMEGRVGLQQALSAVASQGEATGFPGEEPADGTPPGQDPAQTGNGASGASTGSGASAGNGGSAGNGSDERPPTDDRDGDSTGNGAQNGNASGAEDGNGPASEHPAPSSAPH